VSKDEKYIIAYSILIGFILGLLALWGVIMLLSPALVVKPTPAAAVFIILTGVAGLGVCIGGLYSRLKRRRGNKYENKGGGQA